MTVYLFFPRYFPHPKTEPRISSDASKSFSLKEKYDEYKIRLGAALPIAAVQ